MIKMTDERATAIGSVIIKMMTGVLYKKVHEHEWRTLDQEIAAIKDHFATIGVEVIVDDSEGYAYLKTKLNAEGESIMPRLVRRRSLTYNVSLMLMLLRGRLAEFEAGDAEGKLVLEKEQLTEMIRVFLKESNNEVRVIEQAEKTIKQVTDLGFLKELKNTSGGISSSGLWEVQRIIKAYVDAQTMDDFKAKLQSYSAKSESDTAAPNNITASNSTTVSISTTAPSSTTASGRTDTVLREVETDE